MKKRQIIDMVTQAETSLFSIDRLQWLAEIEKEDEERIEKMFAKIPNRRPGDNE